MVEPEGIYEQFERDMPVIIAMWHGQHFLIPFIRRAEDRAKVLVSRHRDGEINALAAERLASAPSAVPVTTAAGSSKGGVSAFKEMLGALQEGYNVALTADIPKVARTAGLGIVKLASASGRPIYPIAIATRRRVEFTNRDRTAINLPFGRGAGVAGEPVRVPAEADGATLECARQAVEASLDAATARAYALAEQAAKIVAERLPLTLHAYRLLTAAATPLAPARSYRLKRGKEHADACRNAWREHGRAAIRSAGMGSWCERRRTASVLPIIERIRDKDFAVW